MLKLRQEEDADVERNRKTEDEIYQASLTVRPREDEQNRKKRAAEDEEHVRIEIALRAEEDARFDILFSGILS
jgi:hypothetical protein